MCPHCGRGRVVGAELPCIHCAAELRGLGPQDHCPGCSRPAFDTLSARGLATGPTVDSDLPCIHCRYNLNSMPRDAACPECGRPIEDSITRFFLATAPRAEVLSIAAGVRRLFIATFLVGIWGLNALTLLIVSIDDDANARWFIPAFFGLPPFACLVTLAGFRKLIRPGSAPRPVLVRGRVAMVALLAMTAAPFGPIFVIIDENLRLLGQTVQSTTMVTAIASGIIGTLAYAFFGMRSLSWIASRIPSAPLAREASSASRLLPFILVVGTPMFFLGIVASFAYYTAIIFQLHSAVSRIAKARRNDTNAEQPPPTSPGSNPRPLGISADAPVG